MADAARLLASSRVSFVVESSVLSHKLLDALFAGDARVLAVHVTAHESVIDGRLRARAAAPPSRVDAVVDVDTSDHENPDVGPIEVAVGALLRWPSQDLKHRLTQKSPTAVPRRRRR